jgi:hypothetical protein
MISYPVHVTGVREMMEQLKEIDPKLAAKFRKELRATANDMASIIQSQIQVTPPLSGMSNDTRRSLRWAGAKATVSRLSLAGSRRKDVTPLLKILVDSPAGAPGYMVAEKAGTRGGAGSSPQGSNLIAILTDRLGTIKGKGKGAQRQLAWKHFWSQRLLLNRAAVMVVDKFERMVTNEMDR